MNAFETIKEIVKNRVAFMNVAFENNDGESFERFRNELNGMMICLKNVNESENFYCINYTENGIEFGFYDADSKWYKEQ